MMSTQDRRHCMGFHLLSHLAFLKENFLCIFSFHFSPSQRPGTIPLFFSPSLCMSPSEGNRRLRQRKYNCTTTAYQYCSSMSHGCFHGGPRLTQSTDGRTVVLSLSPPLVSTQTTELIPRTSQGERGRETACHLFLFPPPTSLSLSLSLPLGGYSSSFSLSSTSIPASSSSSILLLCTMCVYLRTREGRKEGSRGGAATNCWSSSSLSTFQNNRPPPPLLLLLLLSGVRPCVRSTKRTGRVLALFLALGLGWSGWLCIGILSLDGKRWWRNENRKGILSSHATI